MRTALWGRKRRIVAPVSHSPSRSSLSGFRPGSHPRYPAPHPRPVLLQRPPPPPPPARAQRPLSPAPRPPRCSPPHRSRPAPLPVPTPGRVPAPPDHWFRAFLHGGAPWRGSNGRDPLGPAAASPARGRCQVSSPVPESLPGPWSGISRSFSGPKPPTSILGGLFPATIPRSFLLSCGKSSPPFSSERDPYFPFNFHQLGPPRAPSRWESTTLHFRLREVPRPGSLLPRIRRGRGAAVGSAAAAGPSPSCAEEEPRRPPCGELRGGGAAGEGGGGGAELARPGRRLRRRLESGQRRR